MSDHGESRWAGRNGAKAIVRDRVWSRLVETEVNVGPVFDRIPNFVGADVAAKRLGELDAWKRARVVKCNPDPPQIPVRLRALYDGKLLFSPVPCLTKGFPYLRIDPEKLVARGVDFETAATAQGFTAHGEPIGFEDIPKLDFCVVGCVAVTRRGGRTGKAQDSPISNRAFSASLGLSTR
jgi:5-formyltetrahydrofolate cyclo-ligase